MQEPGRSGPAKALIVFIARKGQGVQKYKKVLVLEFIWFNEHITAHTFLEPSIMHDSCG